MAECGRGEVRPLRPCGWGPAPCLSSVPEEKGIRARMPSAMTMTDSVFGTRDAVGTTGRELGWEVQYPSNWMASNERGIPRRQRN